MKITLIRATSWWHFANTVSIYHEKKCLQSLEINEKTTLHIASKDEIILSVSQALFAPKAQLTDGDTLLISSNPFPIYFLLIATILAFFLSNYYDWTRIAWYISIALAHLFPRYHLQKIPATKA
ncbi:hypothetical protein ACVR1I_02715 [Streptococcus cameli]